jgi:hypothetical protein
MSRRLVSNPGAIKRRILLRVIPEPDPETRSVFEKLPGALDPVFFRGNQTPDAYICGSCHTPLIVGLPLAQFQNLVLRCSQCGKHNETLAAKPPRAQPANKSSRRHKKPPRRKK